MEQISKSHVHVKDKDHLQLLLEKMIDGGREQLQVETIC